MKCIFNEITAYFQFSLWCSRSYIIYFFFNGQCFLFSNAAVSECPHLAVLHTNSLASHRWLNVSSVLSSFHFRTLLYNVMGMVTILSEISFSWGSLKTLVVWFLQFSIRNNKLLLFHLYFYFANLLQKEWKSESPFKIKTVLI